MLKVTGLIVCTLFYLSASAGTANAQGPVIDALATCSTEINSYCSAVTPGGGRLVFCMKAHEDKLSSQCKLSINRAEFWLRSLTRTLAYVANQCKSDALKYCPDVKVGEERVLNCLNENRANLNKFCDLALGDVGR